MLLFFFNLLLVLLALLNQEQIFVFVSLKYTHQVRGVFKENCVFYVIVQKCSFDLFRHGNLIKKFINLDLLFRRLIFRPTSLLTALSLFRFRCCLFLSLLFCSLCILTLFYYRLLLLRNYIIQKLFIMKQLVKDLYVFINLRMNYTALIIDSSEFLSCISFLFF